MSVLLRKMPLYLMTTDHLNKVKKNSLVKDNAECEAIIIDAESIIYGWDFDGWAADYSAIQFTDNTREGVLYRR